MLVLSRKIGERIRIGTAVTDSVPAGDGTWVTVVEIDRGKVRLGFEAPQSVEVMREELITDGERVKGHDLSNL